METKRLERQRRCVDLTRFAKAGKSRERPRTATAMDARRRIDKQRQGMEQKRVATAKRSGELRRIEESRVAMELHGIDLQWSSSEQISIDLQWHGVACLAMAKK